MSTTHIGIITIKEEEYQAVLDKLQPSQTAAGRNRDYDVALVDTPKGECRVAITRCVQQGTAHAQNAATEMIRDLQPGFVLVVGIAGGIPTTDFSLGDVVVSSFVQDLTLEDTGTTAKSRRYDVLGGPLHPSATRIVERLRAIDDRSEPWCTRSAIRAPRPGLDGAHTTTNREWNAAIDEALATLADRHEPIATARKIASSDRLIKDPDLIAHWRGVSKGIAAVEMETAGAYIPCQRDGVPVLAVRGISDIIGWQREEAWTLYACHTAASFTRMLISAGTFGGEVLRAPTGGLDDSMVEPRPAGANAGSVAVSVADAGEHGSAPSDVLGGESQVWLGWERHSGDSLRSLSDPSRVRLTKYFNGAAPNWAIAACAGVPRRVAVAGLVDEFLESSEQDEHLLRLLLGAGGEGKSTVLLQTAAVLALEHGWGVLRPRHPAATFHESWLERLRESGQPQVVIVDEAGLSLELLSSIDSALAMTGGTKLHLLATARSSDWATATNAWRQRKGGALLRGGGVRVEQHPPLQSLGQDEAEQVIRAWREADSGIGCLDPSLSDPELAQELVKRTQGSRGWSLFGGLLDVRFSPDQLVDHARDLALALQASLGGEADLRRAFFFVSLCEAAGFGGIRPEVLADLVGVDRGRLWSDVVNPIGEEAAVVYGGGGLVTRHPKIAEAVVSSIARNDHPSVDLGELYAQVVQQTVRTGAGLGYCPLFGPTVHCGGSLAERLRSVTQDRLSDDESHRVALDAAHAAVIALNRTDVIVDYCEALVAAGRLDEAAEQYKTRWATLDEKDNFNAGVRSYLLAWGVTEGQRGNGFRNLFLALLSISDHFKNSPIDVEERAGRSLSGAGRALQLLPESTERTWRARALHGVYTLGMLTRPGPETQGYFESHLDTATELVEGVELTPAEALEALSEATTSAYVRLADKQLYSLLPRPPLKFTMLADELGVNPT